MHCWMTTLNRIEYEILALHDPIRYDETTRVEPPTDPAEEALLQKLERTFAAAWQLGLQVDRPDVSRPLELAENEPMSQIGPSLASPRSIREEGPVNGRYIYYTPIFFTFECMHLPLRRMGTSSIDPNEDAKRLAESVSVSGRQGHDALQANA